MFTRSSGGLAARFNGFRTTLLRARSVFAGPFATAVGGKNGQGEGLGRPKVTKNVIFGSIFRAADLH